MLTVRVRHNITDARKMFAKITEKQLPFATALALTKSAQVAKAELREEMARVFDRPTRYTLNSLYTQPAKKQKLEARVWLKTDAFKGTPAEKYLLPQIEGGARRHKRFERALQAHGLLPGDMYAVPGSGARINGYGNMSAGQITQILSALRSSNDPTQNRRRGKATAYFVGRPGGAPLGVWRRTATGVQPVLIFIRKPTYRKLFRFFEVGTDAATQAFGREFTKAMAKAMGTAR